NVLNNTNQVEYEANSIENIESNIYEELQEGMSFHDWNYAMEEIEKYKKRHGFRMRCYHIKKFKNGDIRRRTIVCEHYRQPEVTKSKDPKKEATSKHVGCIWQINLSCSERKNPYKIIYITKLVNKHKNHNLDKALYNFRENMEGKYFTKVYMPVLQRVIQQFRPKLCDQTNDASRLYKELLKKKDDDPQWYIQVDWNPNSKCLLQRTVIVTIFEHQWQSGMSSTSQVESYNSKVKKLIFNSNTSLLELVEKLTVCIVEEDKKMEYALFRASVPKTVLVATADTILPNVCSLLRKYLTVEILKIQEDQIKQSLQYHATIVIPNKIEKYLLLKIKLQKAHDQISGFLNVIKVNSQIAKLVKYWNVSEIQVYKI
ncbi:4171_t:CDS:2, partial [Gigaspora margarita]